MKLIKALEKVTQEDPEVFEYLKRTLRPDELDQEIPDNRDTLSNILYHCDIRSKVNGELLRKVYNDINGAFHYLLKVASPELSEIEFYDFRFLDDYEIFKQAKTHQLQNVHLYTEPIEAALTVGKDNRTQTMLPLQLKTVQMRRKYLIARQVILESTIGYTFENATAYDKIMKKAKCTRMTYDNIVFLLMTEMLSTFTVDSVVIKQEIIESNIEAVKNYYESVVANNVPNNNRRQETADLHRVIGLCKAYLFMLPNNIMKYYKNMYIDSGMNLQFRFVKNSNNYVIIHFKANNAPRIHISVHGTNHEAIKAAKTPLNDETKELFKRFE